MNNFSFSSSTSATSSPKFISSSTSSSSPKRDVSTSSTTTPTINTATTQPCRTGSHPVQRSASFNATYCTTVPLKIIGTASGKVKTSASFSNCSLLAKVANKSGGGGSGKSSPTPFFNANSPLLKLSGDQQNFLGKLLATTSTNNTPNHTNVVESSPKQTQQPPQQHSPSTTTLSIPKFNNNNKNLDYYV